MKSFLATAVATATLLATGAAYAANAHIVNEGQRAEGGAWISILFAVVVFGLLMWSLSQLAGERLEGGEE